MFIETRQKSIQSLIAINLIVVISYFALSMLGRMIGSGDSLQRTVSFTPALALSVYLSHNKTVIPGIILGAFLSNLSLFAKVTDPATATIISILVALAASLEALIGAYFLKNHSGSSFSLSQVFRLVLGAGILAPVCKALTIAICVHTSNLASNWQNTINIFTSWWIGDTTGILTLTPIFILASFEDLRAIKQRSLEFLAMISSYAAIGWLMFNEQLSSRILDYPLSFSIFPPLIWAALRFSTWVTAALTFLFTMASAYSTVHGVGIFALRGNADFSLLVLQIYLLAIATIGLILSVTISEKNSHNTMLSTAVKDLEKKSQELARSNKELEQFAFVASHDLQEPLRKVIAFGNLLGEESKSELNSNSQIYVQRMISACERMQSLIDDILRFSRITTHAKPFTKTDLNLILQQVISDLEFSIQNSKTKILLPTFPQLLADSNQIGLLFQNLISNSIKFTAPSKPPIIQIQSSLDKNKSAVTITISDNGIGFDQQFSNKIFEPFQRLHKRSEYPGTGIGLAICKKIVERHNGTITAESKPGTGSTFIINLPIQGAAS